MILIPNSEFERLETGPYEKNDRLTPFIVWCHKHVGIWGSDWEVKHTFSFTEVYFKRKENAMRFKMIWG